MKIYLDVSCLNRPFDDQSQARIRLEAEAVILVLERIDRGIWKQVSSELANLEVGQIPDVARRRKIKALLPARRDRIRLGSGHFQRAKVLVGLGFAPADALHTAAAESLRADVLLTCDDRL